MPRRGRRIVEDIYPKIYLRRTRNNSQILKVAHPSATLIYTRINTHLSLPSESTLKLSVIGQAEGRVSRLEEQDQKAQLLASPRRRPAPREDTTSHVAPPVCSIFYQRLIKEEKEYLAEILQLLSCMQQLRKLREHIDLNYSRLSTLTEVRKGMATEATRA